VVRAYTDLKRHNLCDPPERPGAIRHFCNEQLPQGRPSQDGRPGQEFFLTRKLWDAGSSAPSPRCTKRSWRMAARRGLRGTLSRHCRWKTKPPWWVS
jgi:hypothetical protein